MNKSILKAENDKWKEREKILEALKEEIRLAKDKPAEEGSLRTVGEGFYLLGLMRALEVVSDKIIEVERNE